MEACTKAVIKIAQYVAAKVVLDESFNSQDLANLANAFSKWDKDTNCQAAVSKIAQYVTDKVVLDDKFNPQDIANLAHSFSRYALAGEQSCLNGLTTMAQYLCGNSAATIGQSSILGIAQLLKAYRHAGSPTLTELLLKRLGSLVQDELTANPCCKNENLETLASLAMSLCCLFDDKATLDRSLLILQQLWPPIERKSQYLLQEQDGDAVSVAEEYGTRYVALSYYQLLRAYNLAAQIWQRGNSTQQALASTVKEWLEELLFKQGSKIVDSSPYSWREIARLEEEYAGSEEVAPLDLFVAKYHENLPPATFNPLWFKAFTSLQDEPAPPKTADSGKLVLPRCDLRGRDLGSSRTIEYCVFERLAQGSISIIDVKLPKYPSFYLNNLPVSYNGTWYRMDLFGGNRMKGQKASLEEILAEDSTGDAKTEDAQGQAGSLVSIPLHETRKDGPLAQFLRQLFTYQESFFYAQRALFATPCAGIKSVLEGKFQIAIFPDTQGTDPHPFKLGGEIQLRPHDGCGFIRYSIACKMAAVTDKEKVLNATQGAKQSYLPAQALQHYRQASGSLKAEFRSQSHKLLAPNQRVDKETLFHILHSSGVCGPSMLALPSADDNLYTPITRGLDHDNANIGGILIGRAPYHQPNLCPIPNERVIEHGETAEFLKAGHPVLQYSLVANTTSENSTAAQSSLVANATSEDSAGHLWFAKGLLVVVPDKYWPDWPEEYKDCHLVLSAKDIKADSQWTTSKLKITQACLLQGPLVFNVIDIFSSSAALAIPPSAQKRLAGDFDGDRVLLLDSYPELWSHVARHEAEYGLPAVTKPSKSFTKATDGDGAYNFSRSKQIMGLLSSSVLQTFSTLQGCWLALSEKQQLTLAPVLRKEIADLEQLDFVKDQLGSIEQQNCLAADKIVAHILQLGIHVGTDSYKSSTPLAPFERAGKQICSFFAKNGVPTSLPYGKKRVAALARKLTQSKLLAQNIATFVEPEMQQIAGITNLAAGAMFEALSALTHNLCAASP